MPLSHRRPRRRRRWVIETLLEQPPTDADGGEQHRRKRCIGLAVDVGSSSVRCSAYALRPSGAAVAIPGTMWQVVRDALDPVTGTADAAALIRAVEKAGYDAAIAAPATAGPDPAEARRAESRVTARV